MARARRASRVTKEALKGSTKKQAEPEPTQDDEEKAPAKKTAAKKAT